jgi:hypothetical protein
MKTVAEVTYKGTVKGNIVILEDSATLPEGSETVYSFSQIYKRSIYDYFYLFLSQKLGVILRISLIEKAVE